MAVNGVWLDASQRPAISIGLLFVLWKIILIIIALSSPGSGYDTSSTLLQLSHQKLDHSSSPSLFSYGLTKFVRWDAIYFTQIARRGIEYEQEWAFGWGHTNLLKFTAKGLNYMMRLGPLDAEPLAGVILAHLFHFLSCIVLYWVSWDISSAASISSRKKFAFLSTCLHVISPAGIFLSAPYAESVFSFLNFTGFYLYAKGFPSVSSSSLRPNLFLICSGLIWGVATTFRSNGLLSGFVFCFEMINQSLRRFSASQVQKLAVLVGAGLSMAGCAALPQVLAFRNYCVGLDNNNYKRPWCFRRIPSVYSWVQSHYWQVGFMNYWTVSNLPLFIIAAPMLCIMTISGLETLNACISMNLHQKAGEHHKKPDSRVDGDHQYNHLIALRFAIPQIFLGLLALTNYHVQIITRLSSGYPVWYWWLASAIIKRRQISVFGRQLEFGGILVKWMIVYAVVQGGLFATFLPPA